MSSITIRNLIFDLGGVILNIDPQLTVDQLRVLGWKDFYQQDNQSLNRELFYQLERGNSTPEAFRESVRRMVMDEISDSAIDNAWSAMILDIPAERIRYLEELKKSYRIFLLSNTNEIHRIKFHRNFEADFGYSFYDLFEQNFYSHEMGMRKPDPQIYKQVLIEAGIVAEETLFIDDMEINTEAAKNIGMIVLHIKQGSLLETLPDYLKKREI
jgi:putative hydrolase of the HAD superfamily